MTAKIINGKEIAADLRAEMKKEIVTLHQKGVHPHLTVILIGDDPASASYVKGKEKAAAEVGMSSEIIRYDAGVSEEKLLNKINELNLDNNVHGILVQLPLPEHISEQKVIEAIDASKDVDGFHPVNIGKMLTNQETFYPCTPYGIIYLLKAINIEIAGKHAVIIGRSNIVGKPVGQLLLNENATVTYCHSKTRDIREISKQADILVVAIGKAHAIDHTYVKDNAVVIDVGVNRLDSGKLTGDVDFEDVKNSASYITPVPKGVGPMTITMLLYNTIKASKGLNEIA